MQKQSVIAGGVLGLLAFVAGIYLIGGDERKAGEASPPPPAAHDAMGGGAAADMGVSSGLAKGALAAFVVKKTRGELPAISFNGPDGLAVPLSAWKGRVVLVNLWATWCAPCKKEMPDLAKLQSLLGSAEFEVVAVSVDRKGAEASAAFLKANNASELTLYTDPSAVTLDRFQAIGLPATILIDAQGREIGRLLGPADWASPEAIALVKAAIAEIKREAKAGG